MAFFGLKNNKDEKAEKKSSAPVVKKLAVKVTEKKSDTSSATKQVSPTGNKDVSSVLVRPRITEKAAALSERGVYSFEVSSEATAREVVSAISNLYKVKPLKINFATMPAKKLFVRGKVGFKPGIRKAYVYLKKGDKIEIM